MMRTGEVPPINRKMPAWFDAPDAAVAPAPASKQ